MDQLNLILLVVIAFLLGGLLGFVVGLFEQPDKEVEKTLDKT